MEINLFGKLKYKLLVSINAFKNRGLRNGLESLGKLMVELIYRHSDYIVIAKTLSENDPSFEQKTGLTIKVLKTREQIAKLNLFVDLFDLARFYNMLEHGSTCFAAYEKNNIVGCAWASCTVNKSVNRIQPNLNPGDVCVHDLFVSPDCRGRGIGLTLASYRLHYLHDQGYKRAVGAVLEDNTPALIIDKKMGYIQIGLMSHTRFLIWDRIQYTD